MFIPDFTKEKKMKKLFLLTAAILIAGMAFAQEADLRDKRIENFSLETNVGLPIHWTNGIHDDSTTTFEDKFVTANTAIGIAATYNFTQMIGITMDLDFSIGAKLAGYSSPTSDYINLSGGNLFVGSVIYLYNSGALRIPFAAGAHMYYFSDDLWIPELGTAGAWANRYELQFGPEVSLGVQYHFNNGIYMFSRTSATLDFFRWHLTTGSDGTDYYSALHTDFSASWSVKPSFGIGIKF